MTIYSGSLNRLGFNEKFQNWICSVLLQSPIPILLTTLPMVMSLRSGATYKEAHYLCISSPCADKFSQFMPKRTGEWTHDQYELARQCPRLNHLFFADDTMFFTKADEQSATTLKDILRQYETASCQFINVTKSSISLSYKTPQVTKSCVRQILV